MGEILRLRNVLNAFDDFTDTPQISGKSFRPWKNVPQISGKPLHPMHKRASDFRQAIAPRA